MALFFLNSIKSASLNEIVICGPVASVTDPLVSVIVSVEPERNEKEFVIVIFSNLTEAGTTVLLKRRVIVPSSKSNTWNCSISGGLGSMMS